MEKSLRVCPIFKLYWVNDSSVQTIKRYDHNKPFVTPEDLFEIIKKVYSYFDTKNHTVKYREGDELVDLSKADVLSFQFTETFHSVSIYIFSSKEANRNFSPPWKTRSPVQTPSDISSNVRTLIDHFSGVLTSASQPNQYANTLPALQEVHPNVTCNTCGLAVSTSRFICLECPGFNMCAYCERKDLHKHHLMVVVPMCFVKSQGVLYQSTIDSIVSSARKNIPEIVE